MKIQQLFLFLTISLGLLFITGCDDDDDIIINDEEVITTAILTLSPATGGTPAVFSFSDLDGDGGDAPVITSANLAANTTYNASVTLSNDSETPAEDITAEVQEEDDEHQLFYAISSGLNLTVAYEDEDDNGNPLGLLTTFTTGDASTGNFTVTLRHEPNKSGDRVAEGDITNAGGETDIEITFATEIQ